MSTKLGAPAPNCCRNLLLKRFVSFCGITNNYIKEDTQWFRRLASPSWRWYKLHPCNAVATGVLICCTTSASANSCSCSATRGSCDSHGASSLWPSQHVPLPWSRRKYSTPWLIRLQLIRIEIRKMKNAVHSWVRHLGRQLSHLPVQTKLDGFFKSALLRSETSTTSESSIDE
jgi:hypothetical protein